MDKFKEKTLMALAIPIFLELLLVTIVGNIDAVMLGKFSNDAVGAVGGMSQMLNIQNTIFSFINIATTILCSQYLGAKNKLKIKEVITISLILNLILGLILGSVYIIYWKFILEKMNLSFELIKIGKLYFQLVGGMCVFQAILLTCGAVMKSHGHPKEILYINVGVNLLNIFGNALFIYGWFGAPILGTTGVGISTVVSRALGCVVAYRVMMRYCNFKFDFKILKNLPFKGIKDILYIGIPTAGENLAWNVGQIIILSMVNSMGTIMIASRTYLVLISHFVMIFSIALGHATSIQIGHLVGAKKIDKVHKKCFNSLKLSIILAFSITVLLCFIKRPVMNIFTYDKEILEVSFKIFPLIIFLEVGRVFNIIIINSLHATGDIKFPMFMGITFVFIIAVPLSYFFGITLGWGLIGIWLANALDEWVRGIGMYFRWKSEKWKNKSFV